MSENCFLNKLDWLDERIKRHLIAKIGSRELHHFLLFSSLSLPQLSLVSKAVALDWVRASPHNQENITAALHPDLHVVKSQGKTGIYSVESVREILYELSMKSFHGQGKAIVFDMAERITLPAANALLKALEEPPEGTLFIMNAVRLDRVIGTILSRCRLIRLPVADQFKIEVSSLFPSEISESIHQLFLSEKRAQYHEVIQCIELYRTYAQNHKKAFLKELSSKSQANAEFSSSDREELKESEIFSWTLEEGEKIIRLIEHAWKQKIVRDNKESSSHSGYRRFPDESLSFFVFAEKSLELGFPLEEILTQLILSLLGYISPTQSSIGPLVL